MNLKKLQEEQKEWQNKNFPNAKDYQVLLGVGEEVGELNHAHLKLEQGIRGTAEEHTEAKKDAIGDIIIFLAGYCNLSGLDLQECVDTAWDVVKKRDWNEKSLNSKETLISILPKDANWKVFITEEQKLEVEKKLEECNNIEKDLKLELQKYIRGM